MGGRKADFKMGALAAAAAGVAGLVIGRWDSRGVRAEEALIVEVVGVGWPAALMICSGSAMVGMLWWGAKSFRIRECGNEGSGGVTRWNEEVIKALGRGDDGVERVLAFEFRIP